MQPHTMLPTGQFSTTYGHKHLDIFTLMMFFSIVYIFCNRPVEGIASLLQMAADSLRHPNGHLYYLGVDLFGVLG